MRRNAVVVEPGSITARRRSASRHGARPRQRARGGAHAGQRGRVRSRRRAAQHRLAAGPRARRRRARATRSASTPRAARAGSRSSRSTAARARAGWREPRRPRAAAPSPGVAGAPRRATRSGWSRSLKRRRPSAISGAVDQPVEALGLDPQALVERPAEAARPPPPCRCGSRAAAARRSRARARAPARGSVPLGTTSLTSPMRCASCASITRPVMISSIATRKPTIRGSRCVPPSPRPMFQRRQVTPNVACSSAMQRSVQHAHSSPPA